MGVSGVVLFRWPCPIKGKAIIGLKGATRQLICCVEQLSLGA